MLRSVSLIAFAAVSLVVPAAAWDARNVAGRPALSTMSAQDLIAQREKWGTAPSAAKLAKGEPPPPVKSVKPTPDAYAILPTDDVSKLMAERETWGKGPAGYEKKKVVAPPAAGTGKMAAKRIKTHAKGKKKVVKKRPAKAKKN